MSPSPAPRGDWDVVVVGAGPAGATTALSVLARSPGTRVLLLDRDDFPRDKCCGDGIAPHVVDVLEGLGAGDVVDDWAPVEHLTLSRGDHEVAGRMARPARVIPRAVFDARLVEHAQQAGATVLRHRVRRVDVRHDGLVVVDDAFSARVAVGADGAGSVVRSRLGSPRSPRSTPRALALRGYAPTAPDRVGRQVIRFGDRPQPSYAWAFDRGDGWSNVGYGELADSPGLTRALLLDQLGELIPGAADGATSWRAHHLPLSGWGWGREQADGPVLLVGDAAGLVNPVTGEGIYYAVATGSLAGLAAVRALGAGDAALAGQLHRRAVRSLLDLHLRHTWTVARLSRHPRIVDAGIAAAARDRRVFDDLVDLGLGRGLVTRRLVGGLAGALVRDTVPPGQPTR